MSYELWAEKQPEAGDHIRVMRLGGVYYHHGIYISDDEVIHFTGTDDDSILDWSKNEVISSGLKFFLDGGTPEVKIYTEDELEDLYTPQEIITYARACIGDDGYNLIFNNCEHFANVCTLGRFRSHQVEQVLGGGKRKMGLFSWLGGLFGGSSGGSKDRHTSSTTTTYSYEPDRVEAAKIEADAKIRLAGMENERIELMKRARIEMMQAEADSRTAVERVKAQGFAMMAQAVTAVQEKLTEIAEKRMMIIEKGTMQAVSESEKFYRELTAQIQEDDDRYNTEKLPELLEILGRYEEGSTAHRLYMKRVEADMTLQAEHYTRQLEAVVRHQEQIIGGILAAKENIIVQTGEITAGMLKSMESRALDSVSERAALPETNTTTPALPV